MMMKMMMMMNLRIPLLVVGLALAASGAAAGDSDNADVPAGTRVVAAGLGLEPAASLPAQPGPDDYAAYALAHNDDVAAAVATWEATQVREGAVGALPDPRFAWSEAIEPIETRVGPQERALSLTQQVPWFGTLGLRRAVVGEHAASARARAAATALRAVRDVRATYHELVYLEAAITTTQGHLGLLVQWEEVARSRYESGDGRYADAIKAQVEMGMLEDRLAELRDRRRPLTARLVASLGHAPEAGIRVEPVAPDPREADFEALRTRMLEHNPELAGAAHEAATERLGGDLAAKRRYPDFSVGVNWVQIGPARMEGVAGSGSDAVFATFGLSLPLWQGSYGAAEREAAGRYRAAEHRRSDLARTLTTQLEEAVFAHRDARRRLVLYQDALLPKARQSLDAARVGYEGGELGFLDLVDAERILLEFELAAARAAADVMISRADIDRLVGRAGDRRED